MPSDPAARRYDYIGPGELRDQLADARPGTKVTSTVDLTGFLTRSDQDPPSRARSWSTPTAGCAWHPDNPSTSQRWRKVNGPKLVALVRAGARFERGQLVERPVEEVTSEATRWSGRRVITPAPIHRI